MKNEQVTDKQKKGILLPAGLILWIMGLLAAFGLPGKMSGVHLSLNLASWEVYKNALLGRKKEGAPLWIERQDELKDFVYGRHRGWMSRLLLGGRRLSAGENACEVIAVYNALQALFSENAPSLPQLMEVFEKRGISLGGYFGTSFQALCRYFRKSRLNMQVYKGKKITPEVLERAQKEGASACIMMAENHAGHLSEMVHTICISPQNEKWQAHNDYEGSRISDSLSEAVFGYHNAKGRPLGVILLFGDQSPVSSLAL